MGMYGIYIYTYCIHDMVDFYGKFVGKYIYTNPMDSMGLKTVPSPFGRQVGRLDCTSSWERKKQLGANAQGKNPSFMTIR